MSCNDETDNTLQLESQAPEIKTIKPKEVGEDALADSDSYEILELVDPKEPDVPIYQCEKCGKFFHRQDAYFRHVAACTRNSSKNQSRIVQTADKSTSTINVEASPFDSHKGCAFMLLICVTIFVAIYLHELPL